MSDIYHYEEGAIHYDHKRVIHINTLGGADVGKLIGAFLKDDIEDAEIVEDAGGDVPPTAPEEPEELNYFAPTNSLQRLFKQPWFAEVRTSERYDAAWTDAFVEALMGSEQGEQIARDWAVQGKRERKAQVKGHVVGLLKDAGVLKGSYGSIAKKVGVIVNEESKKDPYKTFADYLARGKKQPFAEWVKEYVEGNNKPKKVAPAL